MKLKSIKFVEGDDGEAIPSRLNVEITLAEAVAFVTVLGNLNDKGLSKLFPAGTSPEEMHSAYACLVGDVFNRYWEDGQNELIKFDGSLLDALNERTQG